MDFVEKAKGFLMEPSKTFDASKGDTLSDVLKYYAILTAIYSAILALMFAFASSLFGSIMGLSSGMMTGLGVGIGGAIVIFVLSLVFAIVGIFISGAIIHAGVYIVGGKKGYTQTVKALMYGSTPGLLLGWIPLVNYVVWIWSLVLEILGIRQLQEISTGRAIIGMLVPIIVLVILTTLILAAIIAAFVFSLGGPVPR